jgi:hypothetical protein
MGRKRLRDAENPPGRRPDPAHRCPRCVHPAARPCIGFGRATMGRRVAPVQGCSSRQRGAGTAICAAPARDDVDRASLADYDTKYSSLPFQSCTRSRCPTSQDRSTAPPARAPSPRTRSAQFVGVANNKKGRRLRPPAGGQDGAGRAAPHLLEVLTNPPRASPAAPRARRAGALHHSPTHWRTDPWHSVVRFSSRWSAAC